MEETDFSSSCLKLAQELDELRHYYLDVAAFEDMKDRIDLDDPETRTLVRERLMEFQKKSKNMSTQLQTMHLKWAQKLIKELQ